MDKKKRILKKKGDKIMNVLAIPRENKSVIDGKQFKLFIANSSSKTNKQKLLKRAVKFQAQITVKRTKEIR